MSDSYGQHKLINEKPNCLACIHNETRALFSVKKKIYTKNVKLHEAANLI